VKGGRIINFIPFALKEGNEVKYSEIIAEVKDLYPNEYSDEQYKKWLTELENNIAIRTGAGMRKTLDLEREASVGVPFDRMYIDFLMAQVCLHQHDDESYIRYMSVFKSRYKEWEEFEIRVTKGKKYKFKNWI
jgi:hypothetical protein